MKAKLLIFTTILLATFCCSPSLQAQNAFDEITDLLPTPNSYRTASGSPGKDYWQQQVDYNIAISLDDTKRSISGTETITYHNNSPDVLSYLWLQLDQNILEETSLKRQSKGFPNEAQLSLYSINELFYDFDGGIKLEFVQTSDGKPLHYIVNQTMMRVDLPMPLYSGGTYVFKIAWHYQVQDRQKYDERSGYEYFPDEDNCIYTIAQFYPRLAVYDDVDGWQTHQFLGEGEFSLEFGNYQVSITAPTDHVVAATGVLQNPETVLGEKQRQRLNKAKTASEPVLIVTPDEAIKAEKLKTTNTKTWIFEAENVRDFAFASSRKFIWDAMGVNIGNQTILAMSFYPNEGNPIWGDFSTKLVAHTIKSYSQLLFDYPYPVAQSVHTIDIGMEYPMISFNGGRPSPDGVLFFQKEEMTSVIIHEVGHNFFPMIVNSDERKWTWLDEGLNTFVQYLAEQEWQPGYPSWVGHPYQIVSYMDGEKETLCPLMTQSDLIVEFAKNGYFKPATGLIILRETILGHELFDFAFKEYAKRWKFKRATPADFFRTMEDASGVDLDWFWRAWFFTIDKVDIALDSVEIYRVDDFNPRTRKPVSNPQNDFVLSKKEFDFYYAPNFASIADFKIKDYFFVKLTFSNQGGVLMPLIIQFDYDDGTNETVKIPVEIWRKNNKKVSQIFALKKRVRNVILDPNRATADVNTSNNYWPGNPDKSKSPSENAEDGN